MNADDLRHLLRRPIAFHRALADVAGGATGGLFLSQLLYWSDRGGDPDGWIYKTQAEWREETALTRSEQERARKALRDLGVLEEARRDVPARLYYRLDFDRLASLLDPAIKDAAKRRACVQDSTNKGAASRGHLHTETTAKTTREDALTDADFARRVGAGLTSGTRAALKQAHTRGGALDRLAYAKAVEAEHARLLRGR